MSEAEEYIIECMNEKGSVSYSDVLSYAFDKDGEAPTLHSIYRAFERLKMQGVVKKCSDGKYHSSDLN